VGGRVGPSTLCNDAQNFAPKTRVHSEIINSKTAPIGMGDDIVGRLAAAEREKVLEELRAKFEDAQEGLDTLKSKIMSLGEVVERKEEKQSARANYAQTMLRSSLELEAGLREHWYPVEFVSKLPVGSTRKFDMFDIHYSITRTDKDTVVCKDDSGHETTLTMKEGLIWMYPGSLTPPEIEGGTLPPEGYMVHAELEMEVPVEHGLLMENLLDLAHAPFTHTSTFAKGWSVPDSVKFHAKQMLSGSWDPYPIDMAFDIPCMVNSKIGLVQIGKAAINLQCDQCENHLHQLHVCIPSGEGKTRLLYRMSMDMDGLKWTKNLPGVNLLWRSIAEQVLSEDTSLVLGQQDRMKRGANTWKNPVSYDKLGVRYRRWRNSLDSGDEKEKQLALADVRRKMSAGELFHIEEQ